MNVFSRSNPYLKLVILSFAITFSAKLKSQNMYNTTHINMGPGEYGSDYGFSIGAGDDFPLSLARSELNNIYNSVPYVTIGLSRYLDDFTFSFNAGYRSFKEKKSSYPFQLSEDNYGTFYYHNFSTINVGAGATYSYKLNQETSIYTGLNFGRYFSTYGIALKNSAISLDIPLKDRGFYLAPVIGISLTVNVNVRLNLQSTYTTYFTGVNITNAPGATKTYKTFANGLALVFGL